MSDQITHTVTEHDLQDMILKAMKTALAEWAPPSIPTQEKNLFSRQEVCDQLNITLPTLGRVLKSGHLQTYKIGKRKIMIRAENLKNYISNQRAS
ncbi:MAG: helix-turn-helix domain-containing protein [Saprospiraceae bacterium]